VSHLLVAALLQVATVGEIRGAVTDSVTGQPVAGAVVLLFDAAGTEVGHNITSEIGLYRIPRPAAASRVRFIKLGFYPDDRRIPDTPGDVEVNATMRVIPRMLEAVSVRANQSCQRRADSDAAFAMWQQARSGLLATVVARDAMPARVAVLLYERHFDASGKITQQIVRIDTGSRSTSFTSAFAADTFIATGFYRRDSDDADVFYGPDASVLLSEAFQTRYCFSLADSERDRRGQIGLRFQRAANRDAQHRVDIDGTLWIDTVARVLRDIEYSYTGYDDVQRRYRPGGHVEFRAMANGMVMLDRFVIRKFDQASRRRFGATRSRSVMYFGVHSGGELAAVQWPDGTYWRREDLGTFRATVLDATKRPVPGVLVLIDSTDYGGVTDSTGRVEIRFLLPGPYRAFVYDSTLATIELRPDKPLEFEAERGKVVERRHQISTHADLATRICGRREHPTTSNIVGGRVVSSTGAPEKGAKWSIGLIDGAANDDGFFWACPGRVIGDTVDVRVSAKRSGSPDAVISVRVPMTQRLNAIRVVVP
jgi:hypothetical protein